jgi:hypothetical protein
MTYRKCCIFTGRKSWVHQALYTAGVGDIYHMIQMIKNVVNILTTYNKPHPFIYYFNLVVYTFTKIYIMMFNKC